MQKCRIFSQTKKVNFNSSVDRTIITLWFLKNKKGNFQSCLCYAIPAHTQRKSTETKGNMPLCDYFKQFYWFTEAVEPP